MRLLHSPLQDNVTVVLAIIQTLMIYLKLDGALITWPWVAIFTPLWLFNCGYTSCCIIWFYFHAKSLLSPEYVEICLSGWLKCTLEAVQLGHSYLDYLLFTLASMLAFLIFPMLSVLQLDVFSGLYLQIEDDVLLSFKLSWTAVFATITTVAMIVLYLLHKRLAFLRRNRRYYRLGMAIYYSVMACCLGIFSTLIGLHLDGMLPADWSWWRTVFPLWVIAGSGMILFSGGFDLTERVTWWRRLQNTPYFMTRAPLIGLWVLFIALSVYRIEALRKGIETSITIALSFSFLFGFEAVLVLYWVQDLVDFEGYKQYSIRKRFNFSLNYDQNAAAASS